MIITPETNIILLQVPLTLDNNNQITFTNKQQQFDYFYNLPKIVSENCSYLRDNSVIRFANNINELYNFNYVMYQNSNYSDKWFYAFITNLEYKNDNLTDISIVTDIFQTWQFDIVFKPSFVEREMIDINLDIPGINLIPEGLETGEYKIADSFGHSLFNPVWCIAYLGETASGELVPQGSYIANRYISNCFLFNCYYFRSL